jgi:hypothetical protein
MTDATPLDRTFAVDWYANGWIAAWNQNRPELCFDILTEDFVLDSPTTRHTGWKVQGQQAAADYIGYVLGAYPDLQWEVTAPPMFRGDRACHLYATYDLLGLMKQIGVYR